MTERSSVELEATAAAAPPRRSGAVGHAWLLAALLTPACGQASAWPPPPPARQFAPAAEPAAAASARPDGVAGGTTSALAPRLRPAIEAGVDYLVRSCGPDGRFTYLTHLDPTVALPARYNIVRHAGAMHALSDYQLRRPRPAIAAALARAEHYLAAHHLAPLPRRPTLTAVWSQQIADGRREAKLGAAGLGLLALAEAQSALAEAQSGSATMVSRDELRSLGRFLRFMQKPDGSFYAKYLPAGVGRDDRWISLYYPGEATLGLLALARREPSGPWLGAAANALGALARARRGRAQVPADHWALIATAELLRLARTRAATGSTSIDESLLVAHAVQICESILAARVEHPAQSALAGCFGPRGRTTPTATRVEGLLAALRLLPPERSELRRRISRAVDGGVRFLLNAQVRQGPLTGALPRALAIPATSRGDGKLDPRAGEVRIDYVQHAISAWMGDLERLESHSRQ